MAGDYAPQDLPEAAVIEQYGAKRGFSPTTTSIPTYDSWSALWHRRYLPRGAVGGQDARSAGTSSDPLRSL
jgi:hypothetical protein